MTVHVKSNAQQKPRRQAKPPKRERPKDDWFAPGDDRRLKPVHPQIQMTKAQLAKVGPDEVPPPQEGQHAVSATGAPHVFADGEWRLVRPL